MKHRMTEMENINDKLGEEKQNEREKSMSLKNIAEEEKRKNRGQGPFTEITASNFSNLVR